MLKNPDLFRKTVAGAAMLAWPVLLGLAFLTSPPGTEHDPAVFRASPVQVQASALLFQWATVCLVPVILGLAHLLRTRAPRTGNIGAAVGLIGAVTATCLFMTDFYDLALALTLPDAPAARVTEVAGALGGFVYGILLPGFLTHVGLLVLLAGLAAVRRAPWWVPVAALAGVCGPFLTMGQPPAVQAIGSLFHLAAFGAVALKVLRMPVDDWRAA
ncbi:hypothetical protein [Microbispora siamensis]|uniref:DUF4386 family protein n=1 Tax=Microbispora siamensis TaxID=564413 RepID=A0ABQ4GF54_9ACTN|nr:hypothetical protein [Microbispora siamensis]GIH60024.1 hypothetical protein Msi02_08410 [Microbispora siamensis]